MNPDKIVLTIATRALKRMGAVGCCGALAFIIISLVLFALHQSYDVAEIMLAIGFSLLMVSLVMILTPSKDKNREITISLMRVITGAWFITVFAGCTLPNWYYGSQDYNPGLTPCFFSNFPMIMVFCLIILLDAISGLLLVRILLPRYAERSKIKAKDNVENLPDFCPLCGNEKNMLEDFIEVNIIPKFLCPEGLPKQGKVHSLCLESNPHKSVLLNPIAWASFGLLFPFLFALGGELYCQFNNNMYAFLGIFLVGLVLYITFTFDTIFQKGSKLQRWLNDNRLKTGPLLQTFRKRATSPWFFLTIYGHSSITSFLIAMGCSIVLGLGYAPLIAFILILCIYPLVVTILCSQLYKWKYARKHPPS
jgi:hypothetical protein